MAGGSQRFADPRRCDRSGPEHGPLQRATERPQAGCDPKGRSAPPRGRRSLSKGHGGAAAAGQSRIRLRRPAEKAASGGPAPPGFPAERGRWRMPSLGLGARRSADGIDGGGDHWARFRSPDVACSTHETSPGNPGARAHAGPEERDVRQGPCASGAGSAWSAGDGRGPDRRRPGVSGEHGDGRSSGEPGGLDGPAGRIRGRVDRLEPGVAELRCVRAALRRRGRAGGRRVPGE